MSSSWRWSPVRSQGIWRHGPLWLKPLAAISPWMTLVVCLMMMYVLGGTMSLSPSVLFDLPAERIGAGEVESSSLVVLLLPLKNESVVFFDDARYQLGNGVSCAKLSDHIAERTAGLENPTMLVMADRRIPGGDLARFAAVAREGGVKRMLLANRRPDGAARRDDEPLPPSVACAMVAMDGDAERKVIASSRMAWQLDQGRMRQMRTKLFEDELPPVRSNPVLEDPSAIAAQPTPPPVARPTQLLPPSLAAPPPGMIKREEDASIEPGVAFPRKTMLEL